MKQFKQGMKDIGYHFEKINYKYKFNNDNSQAEFKFIKNSQYFIEATNFQKLQLVKHILHRFSFKQAPPNTLILQTHQLQPQLNLNMLIHQLKTILETFQVCILEQDYVCDKSLNDLMDRLRVKCQVIGFKKNRKSAVKVLIIYFCQEYKYLIEQQIQKYTNSIQMIFSLNGYFADIKIQNYQQITCIFKEQYSTELKDLTLTSNIIQKNQIQIIAINQINIRSREIQSLELTKSQYLYGLYGLKLQIVGKECYIPLLYNMISKFFQNIKFVIKYTNKIYYKEDQIQEYLKHKNIKAFLLKEHQMIIINPPLNLEDILMELNIQKWIISQADFLNHDFSLIEKHQKAFVSNFRLKALKCQLTKIQPSKIQIKCQKHIYHAMLDICKTFLFDMLQTQFALKFFNSTFEFQIFKQYYQSKIQTANVQLRWSSQGVKVTCYSKDGDKVYNIILSLYNQMKKQLIKIQSKYNIHHKLINSQLKTIKFQYLSLYRYQFKKYNLEIQLRTFEDVFNQNFCIFFYTSFRKCIKLNELLDLSGYNTYYGNNYVKRQVMIHNLQFLRSIMILKLPFRIQDRIDEIQQIISKLMSNNKPFNIVLSEDYNKYMQQFIQLFIQRLIFCSQSKEYFEQNIVQIFIVYDQKKDGQNMVSKVNNVVQSNKGFTTVQHYHLDELLIKKIILVEPIAMKIKKMINNLQYSKMLTPLISYIFYYQAIHKKIDHSIAIFPSKTNWSQLLVNLNILQVYLITKDQTKLLHKTEISNKVIILVEYLRKQFKKQSYIVITYNKQQRQPFSSFYVYENSKTQILTEKKISFEGLKIKIETGDNASFAIDKKQEGDIYQLQIHKYFLPKLQRILDKLQK